MPASPDGAAERPEDDLPDGPAGRKKDAGVLARNLEVGEGVAGTVGDALALLEGVLRRAPSPSAKSAA